MSTRIDDVHVAVAVDVHLDVKVNVNVDVAGHPATTQGEYSEGGQGETASSQTETAKQRSSRVPCWWFLVIERLEPVPTGGYVAVVEGGARVDVSRQAARRLRRRLAI